MCRDCWASYDSPADTGPHIERAVELIAAICEEEPTGGPLHSVISNWNVQGEIARWLSFSQIDFSPAVQQAARELAELLDAMPVRERAATLAHVDGYIVAGPA